MACAKQTASFFAAASCAAATQRSDTLRVSGRFPAVMRTRHCTAVSGSDSGRVAATARTCEASRAITATWWSKRWDATSRRARVSCQAWLASIAASSDRNTGASSGEACAMEMGVGGKSAARSGSVKVARTGSSSSIGDFLGDLGFLALSFFSAGFLEGFSLGISRVGSSFFSSSTSSFSSFTSSFSSGFCSFSTVFSSFS